jgi:hypothetical protein
LNSSQLERLKDEQYPSKKGPSSSKQFGQGFRHVKEDQEQPQTCFEYAQEETALRSLVHHVYRCVPPKNSGETHKYREHTKDSDGQFWIESRLVDRAKQDARANQNLKQTSNKP